MAEGSTQTARLEGVALPAEAAARRREGIGRIWSSPTLLAGLAILLVIVVSGALAGFLAPYDPNRTFPGRSLEAPSAAHLLGTDSIGRDVLSRVIHGSRISLLVAIPSVLFALFWGTVLGLVAGYFGGWVDEAITRALDIFFAFPALLLAIALVSALGASVPNLVLTIGVIYTPRLARVVRGPVLQVKQMDYVTAARTLGANQPRILWGHILPNIPSPIIVETALALSRAILYETSLSYLGLGPPPPDPTWGSMLAQSRQFMEFAPWTAVAPGLAITVAVMGFVLIGNGLRDLLDPRLRER